jgi:DNA-binding transcriptional LysR family regulator
MLSSYKNQQVYIQVVDKSSITKAADTLAMSKSSVSRILSLIENEWGVQLLIRSTRNISVTSAGEAVYYHYKKTIEDARQTIKTVESSIETVSGDIRLTSPETFACQLLAPIIIDFSNKYPKVKIELVISSDYERLIEQGFDLAFRIGELEDSTLKSRRLCETKLGLFASKDYLKKKSGRKKPQDLRAENCLIYSGMPLHNQWFRALGKKDYSSVDGNIISNSETFLIELAKRGQGVLLFPERLLKNQLVNGELEQIMEDYSSPININAIYPYRNKSLSNKLRLFLDFVVKKIG